MKRFISGARMLKDLESKKISLAEQMIYLFIVIGPEIFFLNNSLEKDPVKNNAYLNFSVFTFSIFIFYMLFKKYHLKDGAIEKYICVAVPAIVTSYIFLIPLSIILEALFKKSIPKENFEIAFDYILTYYMSLYIPMSLFVWCRKKQI